MEAGGFLEKLLPLGEQANWWHFGILQTRLDNSAFGGETKQNRVLIIPQYSTKVVLKERAEEHCVKIVAGTSVESMESLADYVVVGGTSADGSVFTASSKYLVSADGVEDIVQKAAGFDFERISVKTNIMVTGELSLNADIRIPVIIKNEKGIIIAVLLINEHKQIRLAG